MEESRDARGKASARAKVPEVLVAFSGDDSGKIPRVNNYRAHFARTTPNTRETSSLLGDFGQEGTYCQGDSCGIALSRRYTLAPCQCEGWVPHVDGGISRGLTALRLDSATHLRCSNFRIERGMRLGDSRGIDRQCKTDYQPTSRPSHCDETPCEP